MTNANPPVDNTETELATLDAALTALAVPVQPAELITDALNFLAENGAAHNAVVLDDIYNATSAMLQTAQKLDQGFRASLNIAKTIRQQREDARKALADLKTAIADVDLEVPEIEDLWTSIEEMVSDEQMNYFYEMAWDHIMNRIWDETPFGYTEANQILGLLCGGELEQDHYLWGELKDWMRRAQETIDTGICPPPEAS